MAGRPRAVRGGLEGRSSAVNPGRRALRACHDRRISSAVDGARVRGPGCAARRRPVSLHGRGRGERRPASPAHHVAPARTSTQTDSGAQQHEFSGVEVHRRRRDRRPLADLLDAVQSGQVGHGRVAVRGVGDLDLMMRLHPYCLPDEGERTHPQELPRPRGHLQPAPRGARSGYPVDPGPGRPFKS
jgi:hypothetical protein